MKYRAFLVPAIGILVILVGAAISFTLNDNFVYYMTPSEALENRPDFEDGRRFRLSGAVVPGSVQELQSGVRFEAVDVEGTGQVTVLHSKSPPQLFQENIEVVVEGSWQGDEFHSDTMLIKHDEEYRVPDEGNYPGEGEATP